LKNEGLSLKAGPTSRKIVVGRVGQVDAETVVEVARIAIVAALPG